MRHFFLSRDKVFFFRLLTGVTIIWSSTLMAVPNCDSSFDKPGARLMTSDPDFSHAIFKKSRWRCVTANTSDLKKIYSEFSNFSTTLSTCGSLAIKKYFTTNHSVFNGFVMSIDDARDLIVEAGKLTEDTYNRLACISINSGLLDSRAGSHEPSKFSINIVPMAYRAINGTIEGESMLEAYLIPWVSVTGNIWLEYTAK